MVPGELSRKGGSFAWVSCFEKLERVFDRGRADERCPAAAYHVQVVDGLLCSAGLGNVLCMGFTAMKPSRPRGRWKFM